MSRVAKRFYVSGFVQGVGYRFFAQRIAGQLGISGYVKNLRDGRVEIYAIAPDEKLRELHKELRRGPRGATVEEVAEDDADLMSQYTNGFSIEHEI